MADLTLKQKIELSVNDGLRALAQAVFDDVDESNIDETIDGRLNIAASQTDHAVDFGTISTAVLIYMKPDQDITYKLSGTGNTAYTAKADKPTLLSTSATSLHITTTNAAKVDVIIGGA